MKDEIKVKYSELFWNSKKVPASGLWALLQSDKEVYDKLVSIEAKIEELEWVSNTCSQDDKSWYRHYLLESKSELAELVLEHNLI